VYVWDTQDPMENPEGSTDMEIQENHGQRILHMLLAPQLSPRSEWVGCKVSVVVDVYAAVATLTVRYTRFIGLLCRYDYLFEENDGQWTPTEAANLTNQLKRLARRFLKSFVITESTDCSTIGTATFTRTTTRSDDLRLHDELRNQLITHLRVALSRDEIVRAN